MTRMSLPRLLMPIVCLMIGARLPAQIASLDPTFNPTDIGFGEGDGADGLTRCAAIQPNGDILIGGDFSHVNDRIRERLMRLHPDGRLDTTYLNTGSFNGSIATLAVQPDGKVICGGSFNYYMEPVNCMVRLNQDGSPDASFNIGTGFNGSVNCSALQPDGKLLVGGDFTTVNGTPRNRIARLNTDGSLDGSFDPGSGCNSVVQCMLLQPDGRVLVGGNFNQVNGMAFKLLARLEPDGQVDATFATGNNFPNGQVFALALEEDGQVLAGGSFVFYAGTSSRGLIRLDTDGTRDTTLNIGTGFVPYGFNVKAIVVQSDGRMVIGGDFLDFNGTNARHVARLNADGSLDTTFPVGDRFFVGTVYALVPQDDGRLIVAGGFTTDSGLMRAGIARLNTDGTLDASFGRGHGINGRYTNFTAGVRCSAVQPDGRILVGGLFQAYNDSMRSGLVRIFSDGTFDPSFNIGSGFDHEVTDLALQPDGKVIVCGRFQFYNGVQTLYLVRLNPDGSRDESFDMGAGVSGGRVFALALQPDGKIIAAGDMTNYDGAVARGIVRLNADGSLDPSFVTGNGFDNYDYPVLDLLLQPDGKVLACGEFTEYDNVTSSKIIRLNSDGSQDLTFDPSVGFNFEASARCMALQPDGKILVGGYIWDYNGTECAPLIRLDPDGTFDGSFAFGTDPGLLGDIYSVALQSDGRIIAGGVFNDQVFGVLRHSIFRLEADGTLDLSFDPGSGFKYGDNPIGTGPTMLNILSEEQVLVGGGFTSYQGIGCDRLMRMDLGTSTGWNEGCSESRLTAWPVPASECLYLNTPVTGQVLDATGKVLRSVVRSSAIRTAEFAPGCYVLRTTEGATLRFARE